MDVVPDVELGPVRQREYANAFARSNARIVQVPYFGSLVLWVPLPRLIAERKNSLFRSRLLFIAPRTAECCIEAMLSQSIQERRSLQQPTASLRSQRDWIRTVPSASFVASDSRSRPSLSR